MCKTQLRWFACCCLLAAMGFVAPQAAFGQCAASAAPAYPTTVSVGDTAVAVSLILTNQSAATPAGCGTISVPFVDHVPSCVSGIGTCTVVDPDVFAVSPLTGSGCGTTWTVAALGDPAGTYRFTPAASVTIAVGASCTINFTVNVLKAPVDSNAGVTGLQTLQLGIGQFPSTEVSQTATATGQDETTVQACPPGTVCRASAGACDVEEVCPAAGDVCPPDSFQPSTTTCRASAGVCDQPESCPGTGPACPADTFLPSTTSCRASAGACDQPESCPGTGPACPADTFLPSTTICREGNEATCNPPESCPGTGPACPADTGSDPNDPNCEFGCRTPGFWGTHGGTEKQRSINITSLVIASVGSLTICGETINPTTDATNVNNPSSAIEAICVSPNEDFRLQLTRQLTAAALNCAVNGAGADCSGNTEWGTVFAACNSGDVCDPTTKDNKEAQAACVASLDCLNNGGHPASANGSFLCASGTCSDNGAACTGGVLSNCANPGTATCVPSSNCHEVDLPGFEDPGPAGSGNACNAANKTACNIFSSSCP